jgi:hypothetical protein
LNINIPSRSILQLQPNPARQFLCLNPIEFRLTQCTVQVVNHLVVSDEHVPQSWSKEVHKMNISCANSDIPKDLPLHRSGRCSTPVRQCKRGNPKSTKQTYKLQNEPNPKLQQHNTIRNSPRHSPEQNWPK